MNKTGTVLSILLILIGFIGFIGGAVVSKGIVNYQKELPLGDIKGIVVDNHGLIYIGLGFYGKVQVYDNHGVYLKNWKVDASGGTFNIDLTEDQNILVSTARGNKQIVYDPNGDVISKNAINTSYSETKRPWDKFTTNAGETYVVNGNLFPIITRISPDNRELVKQGIVLQLMKGPFPAWLIAAFGVGLYFLINRDQVIRELKKS